MRLQAYNSTMEDVTDAALWSMPYSCMGNLIACKRIIYYAQYIERILWDGVYSVEVQMFMPRALLDVSSNSNMAS